MHNGFWCKYMLLRAEYYVQCWYHALFVCHPLVIFDEEKVK